jgi:hypothetical protein
LADSCLPKLKPWMQSNACVMFPHLANGLRETLREPLYVLQPLKTWFLSVFYRFLFPIDFPFNPSNVMDSLMKPFSVLTFSRTRRQSMAMVDRRLVGERTEPRTRHVHCDGQLCFSVFFWFKTGDSSLFILFNGHFHGKMRFQTVGIWGFQIVG